MDVIIIGHVGKEHVETPKEEATVFGGAAYYAAVGASLSGASVGLITSVGQDYPLEHLLSLGIDISGVQIVEEDTTFFHIKYFPTFEDRHVEIFLNSGRHVGVSNVPKEYLESRYVHIATNLPQNQLRILRALRELGCNWLSVDCFDQFIENDPQTVRNIVKEVNLYFANEREAQLLAEISIDETVPQVKKLGENGAEYITLGKKISAPAPPTQVVDPTGAGDVFAGCFLGRTAKGDDIESAMRFACEMASRKVASFGIKALL